MIVSVLSAKKHPKKKFSGAGRLHGRRDLSNLNICPHTEVWKFPLQCLAPPRWRAVTHGAPCLRGPHLGTCVDPGKTRSNHWLAYPILGRPKVVAVLYVQRALSLVFIREGRRAPVHCFRTGLDFPVGGSPGVRGSSLSDRGLPQTHSRLS